MGVYGLAWTPATSFREFRTPGAKFWVQGAFGPKFKNLHLPHNMGVYGLAWTAATIFWGMQTPWAKFWVQGAFGTKFKNLNL